MQTPIQLIVGLGNPGTEYAKTRHNVGVWFVEKLLSIANTTLNQEKKFHGLTCKTQLFGFNCHIIVPTTYMNDSGQSVQAIAKFYKIPPPAILVAHDDLDLPLGTIRLKQGGGHGGHNGLRDIINRIGSRDFIRIRIGISHPGDKSRVVNHVLTQAKKHEREEIEIAIENAIDVLPKVMSGDTQSAMQEMHT